MTDLKDMSASELANILGNTPGSKLTTGYLSMLDEATLAFGSYKKQVQQAHAEFSAARSAHMRSYSSETGDLSLDAWDRVVQSARILSRALQELGDLRIGRCKRQTGWGTCNLPLDAEGACTYDNHTS